MLKRLIDDNRWFNSQDAAHSILNVIGTNTIIATLRRQWPIVLAVCFLCVILGIGYVLTAAPRFTATAALLIDTRKNQSFQSGAQTVGDISIDSSAVDSQVEILKSESVALSVIRDLKLTEDPEFVGSNSSSLIGSIFSFLNIFEFGGPSETQLERRAIAVFIKGSVVKRVGLSYVINISYTSFNRTKAANIANGIADAYIVGELDARYQSTKRASRWLQERIAELRTQASEADAAVQLFKSQNGIVDTGRGLMSEQQLGDVNTQMVAARASTAEAKARLDRVEQISREEIPDATVTDALRNDVVNRLRAQLLDISAREADWAGRFGQSHVAVINLRNQMKEIRRSIGDELKRIAQTYRSDYEIAKAREHSLEVSLSALVGQAALTGQAQIKLRDLESSAQTYRNMYDNFLQRFTEATQQQTFPISEARVISAATEPLRKSWPISSLILAGCLILGLFSGVGCAFLWEQMDTMFRTPQQIEEMLGLECLGVLSKITEPAQLETVPIGASDSREVWAAANILYYAADAPFSRFAETLRSAKFAVDFRNASKATKVIGIVSSLPGEGKTTVASNFASIIAKSGQKVLLIDGDMRNPSLTREIVPDAKEGLLEVLMGRREAKDVIWTFKNKGFDIFPTVLTSAIPNTSELISSQKMKSVLDLACTVYDYIIIDLPPLRPVIDARAIAPMIDGFLIVVEWGRTSRDTVAAAIIKNESIRSRSIGVILNKADPHALKRIEGSKGQHYHSYYYDYGAPPKA